MRPTFCALVLAAALAPAQDDPFKDAPVQLAPDRAFDLLHVAVALDVDYKTHSFKGQTKSYVSWFGTSSKALLHIGAGLTVESLFVNGTAAPFKRDGQTLTFDVGAKRGERLQFLVKYRSVGKSGGGIFEGGGLHWIEPTAYEPKRQGFWTQGETQYNRGWMVSWDYPNDTATSEVSVTVEKGWTAISNGILVGKAVEKDGRPTFHWKMSQAHATYLMSIVAGPLDIKKDSWNGVDLWYVVPAGKASLIDASFGDTKDMLTFYTKVTGIAYPWPKYAQNAMYDFGGGMENVSATTLGQDSLTDGRDGFRTMSSLNSHELAHQWFGDYVNCRDWGHIWLNESFATFMEAAYFEHARGAAAYDREIDGDMRAYFGEAQRYRRPIVTDRYPDPDSMFDSHTYPKGGAVLHTFRRMLGDAAFFDGVRLYLERRRYRTGQTEDLCDALTEASGVNMHPWFQQWVYSKGHPVLETGWSYDEASKKVRVSVRQTQPTNDGTPLYKISCKIGIFDAAGMTVKSILISKVDETFEVDAAARPVTVLLDPGHDFLRELVTAPRSVEEQWPLLRFAPNAADREAALKAIVAAGPNDGELAQIVQLLEDDKSANPVFADSSPLVGLGNAKLRDFFRDEVKHACTSRRASAVRGLIKLQAQTPNADDDKLLASLVNGKETYDVVVACLQGLDFAKHRDVIAAAAKMPSQGGVIAATALTRLAAMKDPDAAKMIEAAAGSSDPDMAHAGLQALSGIAASDAGRSAVSKALASRSWGGHVLPAIAAAKAWKDPLLKPALEALTKGDVPNFVQGPAKEALAAVGS